MVMDWFCPIIEPNHLIQTPNKFNIDKAQTLNKQLKTHKQLKTQGKQRKKAKNKEIITKRGN